MIIVIQQNIELKLATSPARPSPVGFRSQEARHLLQAPETADFCRTSKHGDLTNRNLCSNQKMAINGYIYIFIHIHLYLHNYVCMYIYLHNYIYININTYIYIHTYMQVFLSTNEIGISTNMPWGSILSHEVRRPWGQEAMMMTTTTETNMKKHLKLTNSYPYEYWLIKKW